MLKYLLLLLISTAALAENNRDNVRPNTVAVALSDAVYILNPTRTINLVGPVKFNAIELAGRVLGMLDNLAPIQVVINSPGGSVQTGETLINSLGMAHNLGIRVECLVVGAAYSMAFNLLRTCDKIYALPTATFLFHPIRAYVNQPLRAYDFLEMAKGINAEDQKYILAVRAITHMSIEVIKANYYQETMWTMSMLAGAGCTSITEVKAVRGLSPDALAYPSKKDIESVRKTDKIKIILEN